MKRAHARLNDTRGVAMVVVIVVIMMIALIGSFAANLGLNQRKLVDSASGRRAKIYYRAQAGVVDANWRIRVNLGNAFTNPAATSAYSLDVDGDGVNDTNVVIGAENANGVRKIDSTGLDI